MWLQYTIKSFGPTVVEARKKLAELKRQTPNPVSRIVGQSLKKEIPLQPAGFRLQITTIAVSSPLEIRSPPSGGFFAFKCCVFRETLPQSPAATWRSATGATCHGGEHKRREGPVTRWHPSGHAPSHAQPPADPQGGGQAGLLLGGP